MTTIRHDSRARRIATDVDGAEAVLTYREIEGRVLDLHHTFVPVAARGRGIASQLTKHALDHARAHGFKVIPSCPFVAAYIERHPQYRDLLA